MSPAPAFPTCDCVRAATIGAILFAAVLASPFPFGTHQAQAIECPSASDIRVHVTAVHGEIARNSSTGIDEIRRLAGPETVARHHPLLGMIGSAVGVRVATYVELSADDGGPFCATLKAIDIRVGFADRVAVVAREAATDSCLYHEVLSHQLRHASIDDQALDAFVPILSQRLRAVALSIRSTQALDPDAAKASIQSLTEVAVESLMNAFKADRASLHRALDSDVELNRIRSACEGRGMGLIGETPPGRY